MRGCLIFIMLFFFSSIASSSDISRFGVRISRFQETVYAVSIPYLISHGEDLNGKVVSVIGYLALADVDVVFSGKESYENSDVSNGVILITRDKDKLVRDSLFKRNHSFVRVFGRYKSKRHLLQEYNAMSSGGEIEVNEVESSYSPWGFSWPAPKN